MAQRAGRVTCPRCGANNFDTVTSCWKCGAPVGAGGGAQAAPMPAPQAMPAGSAPASPPAAYQQERAPAYSQPPVSYPAPTAVPTGDPGVARRAAIALALTIPFVGLPVGWVFMMIQDREKQAIGRVCAIWSMIALVLHLFLTYFLVQQSMRMITGILLPVISGAARRGASSPDSMPGVP